MPFRTGGAQAIWLHHNNIMGIFSITDMADLVHMAAEHSLLGVEVKVVLPTDCYSRVTVDKPRIPEKEISAALPWLGQKRFAELSYTTPVFDYFNVATAAKHKKDSARIHIIAAEDNFIRAVVNAILSARMTVSMISIAELALSNLVADLSIGKIIAYVGMSSVAAPYLLICAEREFVFCRKLPNFSVTSDISARREQALLLCAEIERQLSRAEDMCGSMPSKLYFSSCAAEDTVLRSTLTEKIKRGYSFVQSQDLYDGVVCAENIPLELLGGVNL